VRPEAEEVAIAATSAGPGLAARLLVVVV